MSTVEKVTELLAEGQGSYESNPSYADAQRFREEMNRLGLLRDKKQSFPLPDTVGRSAFEAHYAAVRASVEAR